VCPPGQAKETFYDVAITGFVLEARASGGKTYYLRYRDTHGKQRQHKIADAKSVSFDRARQTAQILRSRVVLGESPAQERKTLRAIPTLPDGHFKFPHLWPVKFPQAGRLNYRSFDLAGSGFLSW
jgi:hypothetical protein